MRLKRLMILLSIPSLAAADRATDTRAALTALRAEDLRVATVAYRIAVGNRDLCPRLSPWLGLVVHDLRQYAPAFRGIVMSTYNLGDGPAIEAIVPDGPAERAGARAGDRIRAIDGLPVDARGPVKGAAADYTSVDRLLAQFDDAAQNGPVRLTVERASESITYDIVPDQGCRSQVQLETSTSSNASADGAMISISLEAAAAAHTDDELAVSIGHEMAHNILEHRAQLDRLKISRGLWRNSGRNAREIRRTEDEADLLGLYLDAHAGYNIDIAPAYWERIGQGSGNDTTHANATERRAITQRIVDTINDKRAHGIPLTPPIAIPGPSNQKAP